MGNAIVFTSGKGGTGKTTAVGAIGSCLAALGHPTLCIDCDVGLKNLDLTLGLTEIAGHDFSEVLDGTISLDDAVIEHPLIKNLFFLTAPVMKDAQEIDPAAFLVVQEAHQVLGEGFSRYSRDSL